MTEKNFEKELENISEEIKQNEDKETKHINDRMNEMGFLWDRVHEKLKNDNLCYHTKKPLVAEGQDPKDVKIHVLEATSTEPGIVAFVSVSDEAMEELKKLHKKQAEEQAKESDEVSEVKTDEESVKKE